MALDLALLCVLAAASYLLCVAIAGFSYSTGRARAAEAGSRTGSSDFAGGLSGRLLSPLPAAVRAVALKEVRALRRDLRRLASVIAPVIILLGAFFINSGGFSEEGGPWYAYLIPYAPAVLAGGMLSLVLTSYSVGTEGSSYWYLAASPLTPAKVLAGKLAASVLYGAGCSLIVCVLVSLFTGAASVTGFIAGTAGGTVAGAVLGLYGVGISAMYARFDADNPNQALTQAGGFVLALMFFGLMATAGIAVGIGFGLAQLIPVWLAIAIAALAWTGGCAVGGYAVAAAGAASLARIDL